MEERFIEIISTTTIAIAVFCAVFCWTQYQYRGVVRSFALFLLAVAVNNLSGLLMEMVSAQQDIQMMAIVGSFALSSSLCLAPSFWVYVFMLTSDDQRPPAKLMVHFILPVLALSLGVMIVFLAPEFLPALMADGEIDLSVGEILLAVLLTVLDLSLFAQFIIYVYHIVLRLVRYRRRLQDYYASTEQHELRWIYVIGGLASVFWLAQVFAVWRLFVPEDTDMSGAVLSCVGFSLFLTATFWGLRQRPALVPNAADSGLEPSSPQTQEPEKPVEKYGKSALTAQDAARIERKLRAAMDVDHLYRDPNLSLWQLARHVGASPNYISQTMNEVIGESFFDFINRHRIIEAMSWLSETDETVLEITYKVGFNTRSSFYTAFKRVSHQTPTNYRKTMSVREGSDDNSKALREIRSGQD